MAYRQFRIFRMIDPAHLLEVSVPVARLEAGNGHEGGSIEPYDDRTIDGESGASEWHATRARQQAIRHKRQDIEFLAKLTSIAACNGGWRPFI